MRSRESIIDGERVAFLAYVWSCMVCGNEWSDEAVEQFNAGAALRAKALVRSVRGR